MELYLRYWQAPGRAVSSYDLRSDPGDFRRVGASTADLASSIRLDSDHHAYRPGEGKGKRLWLKARILKACAKGQCERPGLKAL